jgi:hypothetical protein
VAEGETLPVKSPRGQLELAVHTERDLARGAAVVYFNQPGADVAALLDAALRVTEVRIDTGKRP